MPAIRLGNSPSGLPPNIVEQIMDAERIPIKNMETMKAKDDDRLKLVTEFETKINDIPKNLTDLVGLRGFTNAKLTSADPSIVEGSIDPALASPGEWNVEVIQLADRPGVLSNRFADKDETVLGTGYIQFETNDGTKEVYISGNSTLENVVKTINASGTGVRAVLFNDRSDPEMPYRIELTGLKTGKDNHVEFPLVYMLDGDDDFVFDEERAAQNAKIKLDGFELEVTENTVNDLIPGVSLDLKKALPGQPIKVTIKEDYEVIEGKIKAFVDAYNAALGFIQNQHKLTKGPDGKERLGPLGGDGMLRNIESTLRRLVQNPVPNVGSRVRRLNELGVEFNRNGTLNLNSDKFKKMVKDAPGDVAIFLRGDGLDNGFIPQLKKDVTNMTNGMFGPVAMRKRSIQTKIDQSNKRIETKEKQLVQKEESLRKKFADLETKVSGLQQQGAAAAAMGLRN